MSALLPCPCCQSDEPVEDCPVCGDLQPGTPVEMPTFKNSDAPPCPFKRPGATECHCPFCTEIP